MAILEPAVNTILWLTTHWLGLRRRICVFLFPSLCWLYPYLAQAGVCIYIYMYTVYYIICWWKNNLDCWMCLVEHQICLLYTEYLPNFLSNYLGNSCNVFWFKVKHICIWCAQLCICCAQFVDELILIISLVGLEPHKHYPVALLQVYGNDSKPNLPSCNLA